MDGAHRKTDEKLAEMEAKLTDIYSRAKFEIGESWKEYMVEAGKEIEGLQREYTNAVKSGDQQRIKKAKKKLAQAKRERTIQNERFKALSDQVAVELLKVNETALAYINGELPDIYSLNYNAVESDVDGVGGYSFTLVDADTIRNLATKDESLLPYKYVDGKKDTAWNIKKINGEVLQGIIQGESMDKIATRLEKVIGMDEVSSIRNARTMVTGAECKGRQDSYERAVKDGIIMKKEWMATNDGRTRHTHHLLDGKTAEVDEPFMSELGPIMFPGDGKARPANVYNCFIGETKVASDSETIRSYKHQYSGDVVTVKTAGGVEFTCTPNHPILTTQGWVDTKLLNNGDYLLVTGVSENRLLRVDPNIKHTFPRMDTFHEFLDVSFGERTTSMSVDFHGDVPTSNVEVVTKKRFLRKNGYPSRLDCVYEFLLKLSDKPLTRKCSLVEHIRSVCQSSFRFVRGFGESLSFFWRRMLHPDIHGLGSIPGNDVLFSENPVNDLPADFVIDGELLDRLSGKVFPDKIVSVNTHYLSTHVYNLQTENGYYFVNSSIAQNGEQCNGNMAIAKNCRCTMVAKVVGFAKSKKELPPDIYNIPKRPKKRNFSSDDEYKDALKKYHEDRNKYDSEMKSFSDSQKPKRKMTIEEFGKWAKENEVAIDGDLEGIDMNILTLWSEHYGSLIREFPIVKEHSKLFQKGKFTVAFLKDEHYAVMDATRGTRFFADCSDFDYVLKNQVKNIAEGFLVKGSESMTSMFDHEFGHVVYDAIKYKKGMTTQKRVELRENVIESLYGKSGMSEYATTNDDELFAEAFAAYFGKEDSEFARSMRELLKEKIR